MNDKMVSRISDLGINNRGLLSGIYGYARNSEFFIGRDLYKYSISQALYLYLKGEGYHVVFYNPTNNRGLYSFSKEDLLTFSCLPHQKKGQAFHGFEPKVKGPFGKITSLTAAVSGGSSQDDDSPQIIFDKTNGFYKRYSVSDMFKEVFDYSDNHRTDKMAVVFENPKNIVDRHPEQIESRYNDLTTIYRQQDRQLKMIVVFEEETSQSLMSCFSHQTDGNRVFLRSSFAIRFGLNSTADNNDAVREQNFHKTMFCIDLPREDEIENLLVRRHILKEYDINCSSKPFNKIISGISTGNFRVQKRNGKLEYAQEKFRTIEYMNKADMSAIVSTISSDGARCQLDALEGLDDVRRQIYTFIQKVINSRKRHSLRPVRPHMVLMGPPGVGKTTVARILAQLFREEGLLPKGHFVETKVADLIGEYVGQTRVKTQAVCERALGGLLFIDEAYGLMKTDSKLQGANEYGQEAVEVLMQYMENHADFSVVMAGYQDEMESFIQKSNAGMESRIDPSGKILFSDYKPEVLFQIAKKMLGIEMNHDFEIAFKSVLELQYNQRNPKTWGNAREVERLVNNVLDGYDNHGGTGPLQKEHIPQELLKQIDVKPKSDHELFAPLDGLVGLSSVKQKIREIAELMRSNLILAQDGSPIDCEDNNLAFVFQGNPGSGKTTVARRMGSILNEIGILRPGTVVPYSVDKILSSMQGETEANVEAMFADNIGKVVFIDEAYGLIEGGRREALNKITEMLTDNRYRGKVAIIMAGYPADMQRLLNVNPGTASRFGDNVIDFEDYNTDELWEILKQMMAKKDFYFEDMSHSEELAKHWFDTLPKSNRFANGRKCEQLLKELRKNSVRRLGATATAAELRRLMPCDFPNAVAQPQKANVESQKQNIPQVSFDFSQEDENLRAVSIDGLKQSVGILETETGMGTAFIVSLKQNYILTCSHVVENCSSFTFKINNQEGYQSAATLVWNNPGIDMALLTVDDLPENARYLSLHTDKQPVEELSQIILCGYPLGESVSKNLMINRGEINNYEREKPIDHRCFDIYLSSVPATHGNSGGPVLLADNYKVIGLLQGGYDAVEARIITDIHQLLRE